MKYQTSRRTFMSSIALLSAGAALGSANDFFLLGKIKGSLKQQWSSFWKQNGGSASYRSVQSEEKFLLPCCNGHIHKTGEIIYFSEFNMLAQPTWIYWGKEKSNPDDVVITFFENSHPAKKIFRINRFELETVCALSDDENIAHPLEILKQRATVYSDWQKADNDLRITTSVSNGKNVRIVAKYSKKEITIENKLIYNT
jgi:hypothetical protein